VCVGLTFKSEDSDAYLLRSTTIQNKNSNTEKFVGVYSVINPLGYTYLYCDLAGRPTSSTVVLLISPSKNSMCYAGHITSVIIERVTLP